jgi:hypothetical protein
MYGRCNYPISLWIHRFQVIFNDMVEV